MTWWMNAAQYATEVLAFVLIVRLLSLRVKREGVYLVFALFLAFQLLTTAEYFVTTRWFADQVDYRILWLVSTAGLWIFSLALVYSLAKAVLAELPGVMRFSRVLLQIVFPTAIIIGLLTVRGEYSAAGGANYSDPLDRLLVVAFALDRAISMSALLVLLAILGFILWFPVKMPRNLAIFSVGFVVYFGLKTGLSLLRTYSTPGTFSRNTAQFVSNGISLVLVLCFIYWIVFIDPKGQTAAVRIGHSWRAKDQRRLLNQLESLDLALLRGSHNLKL
jgi:hypothetical protein